MQPFLFHAMRYQIHPAVTLNLQCIMRCISVAHLLTQPLDLLISSLHLHLPGPQSHKAPPLSPAALQHAAAQAGRRTLQQRRTRLVLPALAVPGMQAAAQLPHLDAAPGSQGGRTSLLLARVQMPPCLQVT